jgi:hypothetical protein
MMFLDCPAYLDQDGAARCGLPAEVSRRFIMHSTDGPLESAMIRCPAGHWFNGPIESLTWDRTSKRDPGAAAVAAGARRDSLAGRHDRTYGSGGSTVRETPADPGAERLDSRPNGAPAYYLGRAARVWIAAMRPAGRRSGSHYPAGAPAAADSHRHPDMAACAAVDADLHAPRRGPGVVPAST